MGKEVLSGSGDEADADRGTASPPSLEQRLLCLLDRIELAPRRLVLDTGGVRATAPMLRGIWGRALKHLDTEAYARVFEGRRRAAPRGVERTPLYLIRPAPVDPKFAPALDWFLIGPARRFEEVLVQAWDVASGMGLGPVREPFRVRRTLWLDSRSAAVSEERRWPLRAAADAIRRETLTKGGARLHFRVPLRLLRRGRLIDRPTFADIALAAVRRLVALGGGDEIDGARMLVDAVLASAARVPCAAWRGGQSDFVRWSGTQRREIDMHGVAGSLDLPEGAGELWPLVVAGHWLHVGKGTVFGLGQIEITSP